MTGLQREGVVTPPLPPQRLRVPDQVRDALHAVGVYVGVRLLGLLMVMVLAAHHHEDALGRLTRGDALHLIRLAEFGYDPVVPPPMDGKPGLSNIAFFPLYPALVRLVASVPGVSLLAAGFAVTAIAGIAAAVGLDRFGRILPGGRAGGLVLVALFACWPHSIVLAMPYTEALFVALAVWSLVALLDGRWLTSGVLCLLAGATRPLGTALAAAVALAALAVIVGGLLRDGRLVWRPLAAAALAPLGFLGYWGWLWMRTGRPDAWFFVQANEWHSTFDGGRFTVKAIDEAANTGEPLVLVVNALVVVVSLVLLVALLVERPPLAVALYALLGVASVFGAAGYDNAKARFLLCVFPLLVPVARVLRRAPWQTAAVLFGGLVLISAWYNAFVLVVWTRSP